MASASPLTGLRVLDLSRLLPGPFCSLILADLGADVLKVEDTRGGDYLRVVPPTKEGLGGAFYALNRGKRSLSLDLKREAGRAVLLRLLPRFDVLLESFRPGVLDRLGLDTATLWAARKDLVICRISGYGQSGPLRDRAGHDIDYLALSGVLGLNGEVGGAPMVPGIQVGDVAGGALWATIEILAALRAGGPADLDVSLTEGAMSFLLPWLGELAFGAAAKRRGENHLDGGLASYGTYGTADDRHLAVGSIEPKFWGALRQHLGQAVQMADHAPDPARQSALRAELAATFAEKTRDAWAEELAEVDACIEPVLALDELAEHPQHQAREMFFTLEDEERGPSQQLRLPLGPPVAVTPAPAQGAHSREVLREHGFEDEEIDALLANKTLRQS